MGAILERLDEVSWSTCRGGWCARCPACGAEGATLTITLHHGVGVAGCLNGCLYSAVQAAFDARAEAPVCDGRASVAGEAR